MEISIFNKVKRLLIQLSKDSDGFVRRTVADNPNTPPEVLSQLSKEILVL